jgi:hypothetical protein
MLRLPRLIASTATLIASVACLSLPRLALQAEPGDLEMLAGEWVGEYESASLGRHGSLEFSLVARTNEARGAVVMVPRGQVQPYQREPHEDVAASDPFNRPILSIRFVRASHGSILGMLDRYWDPDRLCYATTVFRGEAGESHVAGTFRTSFDCGGGEASGTWHAVKKSARR